MVKKIRLVESDLHNIIIESVRKLINELNAPVFGNGRFRTDYTPTFKELEGVENLHNDRYKDYDLEEEWKNWQSVGFDKNCEEYYLYCSESQH